MDDSVLWDEHEDGGDPYESPAQPLRASWDPLERPQATPVRRPERTQRQTKRRSSVGWFVHRYGWRAYGIPILLAATVLAVIQMTNQSPTPSPPVVAAMTTPVLTTVVSGVTTVVTMPPETVTVSATVPAATDPTAPEESVVTDGSLAPDPNGTLPLDPGQLPDGGPFIVDGERTFSVVPGTAEQFGAGSDVRTYAIEVEDGVTVDGGPETFATLVDKILSDPRSWTSPALGGFAFVRVDPAETEPDFRISLTSQMTIRELCGYDIQLEASCYNSAEGRVLINDARWVRGAVAYAGDVISYRSYAINHEVGHALGFGHQACAEDGGLAPVMMQQSWSVSNDDLNPLAPQDIPRDGKVCKANPFPDPLAGQGTPTNR